MLAAATTLGPALSIALGAAGAEAIAMECFIAIIPMLLIVPSVQLIHNRPEKGIEMMDRLNHSADGKKLYSETGVHVYLG